jgi:uncharacterized protein (DUF2252 family)
MATELGAEIPSPDASGEHGRAQRESVPRTAHADLVDRPRAFDPVKILVKQGDGRVPELLPVRYGRMAADEFSFLRGAAAVMAADIALGPSTDLTVQLCGDAHLSNFGVFFSPERRLVFDINDFDETHPGPFEWDVKRLVASIAVAGESLNLSKGQQERAVFAAVQAYRNSMRLFALGSTLEVWYAHLDLERTLQLLEGSLSDEGQRRTERLMLKARSKDSRKAYSKLVVETADGPVIRADPPLVVPIKDLALGAEASQVYEFLRSVLKGYEETLPMDRRHLLHQFTPIDAARKVVGVGSVGTRCFVVLMLGRDGDDPFFLQVKEATASVLEQHLGPSKHPTSGQRVVAGQQLTQATPDAFLGWFETPDPTGTERHFYVRQLYDGKASADVATFDGPLLRAYANICGWTLAHSHARSGDRFAIASYLGKSDAFDRSMASFALSYVARNRADHAALTDAIAQGKVPAEAA